MDEQSIYELMSITRNRSVTLSSVLLFGLYPVTYFPQFCITAVVVPGKEIGEADMDGARFWIMRV